MTKQTEALKMAIEFIHKTQFESGGNYYVNRDKTIQACKEALAETQEPMIIKQENGMVLKLGYEDLPNGTAFYTTPPSREWQSLSDEGIIYMYNEPSSDAEMIEFARAIEAKLREKNG